jgi:nitric oxide reductase activation protein
MWEFLELEEQIGRYWHRLVGKAESYAYYPDAAVTLDSVRSSLSVFFRGRGGGRHCVDCSDTAIFRASVEPKAASWHGTGIHAQHRM